MGKQNNARGFENDIVVMDSDIHGKGIFASVDIPKNAVVMPVEGEIISPEECVRREEEEHNVYIFWNDTHYIDTAQTDKIRFINHSCDPNCIVGETDSNTLQLISCRKISSGEEITIDYGYQEIYEQCGCSACSSIGK